jgi:hypothetical protein
MFKHAQLQNLLKEVLEPPSKPRKPMLKGFYYLRALLKYMQMCLSTIHSAFAIMD